MNEQPQAQTPAPSQPVAANTSQTWLPTQNKPALFAYYFGVFGLIPFLGLPLSLAALVLGVMGLKKFQRTPTPGAKGHALTGVILGTIELLIFTTFIIVMIVARSSN